MRDDTHEYIAVKSPAHWTVFHVVLAAVIAFTPRAHAQSGPQDNFVHALVREAMDAYQNLEIDTATERMRDASRRCGRRNCSPRIMAEIQIANGVLAIGARHDRAAAERAFTAALAADPSATVDPSLVTPEVSAAFNRARRAGRTQPVQHLLHTAVQEQLVRTPTPIYVETGVNAAVRADLFWRVAGEGPFVRVEMRHIVRGWGAEIPCTGVLPPALEYYAWAYDERDVPFAEAGNDETPFRIEVVSQRTRPAPSMPGELPPDQCRDTGNGRGEGESCDAANACGAGFGCDGGVCHSTTRRSGPPSGFPLFAIDVGGGFGVAALGGAPGYDEADQPVDPANPAGNVMCRTGYSCPTNVSGAGVTGYLTLSVRGHFMPRIGVGASLRIQPDAGPRTTLSMVLIGLEGYYVFYGDSFRRTGLSAMALVGIGVGQIQARAPAPSVLMPNAETAHIIAGLQNFHLGARAEYAFHTNVHAGAEIRVQFLWPRFLFDVDFQATLGVHF